MKFRVNKLTFASVSMVLVGLSVGANNLAGINNVEHFVNASRQVEIPSSFNKSSKFLEVQFGNEMPIFGYISMPGANASDNGKTGANPSFIHYDAFKMYKDAGFNTVIPLYSTTSLNEISIRKEIEMCNELGLGYVIRDNRFHGDTNRGTTESPSAADYYSRLMNKDSVWYFDEPCVVGIQTKDEPNYYDLKSINNVHLALAEYDDTKWAFTNLYPLYAKDEQLGVENMSGDLTHEEKYHEYIEYFLDNSKSSCVLYDLYFNHVYKYPLSPDRTYNLLSNFSYFSNLARDRDISFMTAVAPYRHGTRTDMTFKELRWTVNMSLAYGTKGIEYYTYWPGIGGVQQDAWEKTSRAGLVTYNGIPHDSYYHAKEINENIKVVDDILMPATFKGFSYFGNETIYLPAIDRIQFPNPLLDITGGDAFVGVFEKDGKQVYYIVNNSIEAGNQTFIAKFNKKLNVHLLNNKCDTNKTNVCAVGFNLSAGEAMLVEVL